MNAFIRCVVLLVASTVGLKIHLTRPNEASKITSILKKGSFSYQWALFGRKIQRGSPCDLYFVTRAGKEWTDLLFW